MGNEQTFKVAAAQAAPIFLDRQATIKKACDLIAEAGRHGTNLVVFPEAFVPGYPDWVWLVPGGNSEMLNQVYAELLDNAVSIPSTATQQLCQAAKEANIHVVMGINERNAEASNGSLYNSLLYIDNTGEILGTHRKLMPTAGERTVWSQGDGSTLETFDTPFGRLGGLLCWENYMPLARHAMYASGTQIYVAPTWDSGEMWLSTMRHVAKEGGMYVIGVCTPLRLSHIPDRLAFKKLYPEGTDVINPGLSCIVNPQGDIIAGPLKAEEGILYAEVDHKLIAAAKRSFDVAGHYARPDVFQFLVNRKANHIMQDLNPTAE